MYTFHVSLDKVDYAKKLSDELYFQFQNDKGIADYSVIKILNKLKKIKLPTASEMSPIERWDNVANSMPGDIAGKYKNELSFFLSGITSGDILEAMCGFNSYILPDKDKIVMAQDYSRRMLLRYEYPERIRFQFDLNDLPDKKIELPDESFDNIVFIKGYKYINSPVHMFEEWHRLLKRNGKLIFVESTLAGYRDIMVRELDIEICKKELVAAGFSNQTAKALNFKANIVEDLDFLSAFEEKLILFNAQKT